ncbi:hypothetical protein [Arthrobacter russicus]|uniref:Uncharacterized protein n=1 Tax=Arthrobacter russicus TaxID=172040 RepID=A0ABU1JBL7_9MICC|nr:hypothetical protein [Arthrobacter russicus]MDR6269266.1 hypothetical protein [Arthrobacter russicus]
MFLPFQALDATRDLARSALPDAAVVEHVPDAPRRVGALRLGLAKTLHALAGRIAGENRQQSAGLRPTELAH